MWQAQRRSTPRGQGGQGRPQAGTSTAAAGSSVQTQNSLNAAYELMNDPFVPHYRKDSNDERQCADECQHEHPRQPQAGRIHRSAGAVNSAPARWQCDPAACQIGRPLLICSAMRTESGVAARQVVAGGTDATKAAPVHARSRVTRGLAARGRGRPRAGRRAFVTDTAQDQVRMPHAGEHTHLSPFSTT